MSALYRPILVAPSSATDAEPALARSSATPSTPLARPSTAILADAKKAGATVSERLVDGEL